MRHSTISLTMDRYTHTLREADRDAVGSLPSFEPAPREGGDQRATGTDGRALDSDGPAARLALCLARKGTEPPNLMQSPAVLGEHTRTAGDTSETPRIGEFDANTGGYNDAESSAAEYPSGLRGRIANPLFAGSNPASAFVVFAPGFRASRLFADGSGQLAAPSFSASRRTGLGRFEPSRAK